MNKIGDRIRTIAIILALLLLPLYIYLEFKPEDIEEVEYGEEYYIGYEEGYRNAVSDSLDKAQYLVEDDFLWLEDEIKENRGISAEEAILSLIGHTDGMELSEAELENAIWAMRDYYHGVTDIIYGIDDYVDYIDYSP